MFMISFATYVGIDFDEFWHQCWLNFGNSLAYNSMFVGDWYFYDLGDGIFIDVDQKRLPKLRLAEVQVHSFFVPVPQEMFSFNLLAHFWFHFGPLLGSFRVPFLIPVFEHPRPRVSRRLPLAPSSKESPPQYLILLGPAADPAEPIMWTDCGVHVFWVCVRRLSCPCFVRFEMLATAGRRS